MYMNIQEDLLKLGFDRVEILDGSACGISEKRLILCFAFYLAEPAENRTRETLIHPYYPVSQRAYMKAREYVKACKNSGIPIEMADHIRIKRVLNRMPFLKRGKNTLAYLDGQGSRFHVQVLTSDAEWPVTCIPEAEEHPAVCGDCRKCMNACPAGAITAEGFRKEKCLRWWMLNGKCPPADIRKNMGNRLLGCDLCESCCPMNPVHNGQGVVFSLERLLRGEGASELAEMIGSNYAIPNRLLVQGCVIAESLLREDQAPRLKELADSSGSPEVRKAAVSALHAMTEAGIVPEDELNYN